jgi:coproporphyrinogen III oxidase
MNARRSTGRRPAAAGIVLIGTCSTAWATGLAADDERLARLAPAERAIAQDVTTFIARVDEKYLARIAALNGGAELETLEKQTGDTDYLVRVTRGSVVEKAGTLMAVGKKTQPGRSTANLLWSRFYSLDIHPRSPLVGMLHATVVVQFYDDGQSFAGGWLGVMNGTRNAADMARLKEITDAHFARHGRDAAPYRGLIVRGTEDTVQEFRRRPDDSGVSFYGPPVYPGDTGRSHAFIAALFEQFTDAYLDIVARRAAEPFTPGDLAAQDRMRKRWLIDQLFSDPFASKLVPFEVWSLATVPPVVKF